MNIIPNHLRACRLEEMAQTLPRTCAEDHNDRYSAGKGDIEMSLTKDQVYELNRKHGWFEHGDAQGDVSLAFANEAIAAYESLRADAPAMLDALAKLVELAECYELKIDGEWGTSRKLHEIEADGDLPPEIIEARALIAKHRGGNEYRHRTPHG